jgi:hypothetical protein
MEQENSILDQELTVDLAAAQQLKTAAIWAKFIAIIGYVVSGLFLLVTLGSVYTLFRIGFQYSFASSRVGVSIRFGIGYLIGACVLFYLSKQLFQFSRNSKIALQEKDPIALQKAFQKLKIYFIMSSVLAIMCIVLSILVSMIFLFITNYSR